MQVSCPEIAGLFYFKNDYIGRGEHTTLTAGNAPHLAEPPFFFTYNAICKNDYVYSGATARNLVAIQPAGNAVKNA